MVLEKNSAGVGLTDKPKERQFLHEFSAEEIKAAMLEADGVISPLEEMISTAEAAFELIRALDMEVGVKDGFWVLEKEFEFWRRLAMQRRS